LKGLVKSCQSQPEASIDVVVVVGVGGGNELNHICDDNSDPARFNFESVETKKPASKEVSPP
jgi:hypothetical protein